jgi:hypothetical protein
MKFAVWGVAWVVLVAGCLALSLSAQQAAPELKLNDKEYFELPGLNAMAFQDIYPEGHQAIFPN